MDDQAFAARLKQLQEVLDERVIMLSKPTKPRSRGGKPRNVDVIEGVQGQTLSFPEASPGPSQPSGAHQPPRTAFRPSSHETDSAMKLLETHGLQKGQAVKTDATFCPWSAVITYPGRFIGKANRPRARVYFDSIYEGRNWDFFYVHNPEKPTKEPFLLVLTAQFVAFLDHINKCLNTALVIPRGHESKFSVQFRGPGMPQPRYLTRSSDQRTFKVDAFPEIADDDLEAYEATEPVRQGQILKALDAFSSRAPKEVRKDQLRQQEDAGALLDMQRLLGVKPSSVPQDVVFICVDVEALERGSQPVSEIGLAVLDTRDLKGVTPGPAGRNWWPLIQAHHLRVKEYSGLRNYKYVQGCPNKFSFGTSTFPPKTHVAVAVMEVLKPWYPGDRDLVLVGHDLRQDIKYLAELDINTRHMNFVREIDNQVLHKSWRQLKDGRGLDAVLSELCIQFNWLHNAGNDAVYTLRAAVGVAFEQAMEEELLTKGKKYVPTLFTA